MKRKTKHQEGQSTIEFILTFSFGIGLIFIIFSSSINYVAGYLVHYATFMSGRTYLTADNSIIGASLGFAESEAKDVFSRYSLEKFKVPSNALSINNPSGDGPDSYIYTGVYAVFTRPVDIMGKVIGSGDVQLVSEAFLGKEASREACITRTCYAITGSDTCPGASASTFDITVEDNGC